MTKPAKTVAVFGVYLILTGAILISIPNVLLGSLRIEPAEEPWIRVLGAVVVILGYYYFTAARSELTSFFRATCWGRIVILALFLALVVIRMAPPQLIVFGVIDASGAFWTWTSLRRAAPVT